MKKLWMLMAAIAVMALFSTCSLTTSKTTIDQCISNFMSDLNGNQASIYTNLDSSSQLYAEASAATYWNSFFPSSDTYTLSNKSTSGETVTATIYSATLYATGASIVFTMSTDATGNAVIQSISLIGTPIFY
jgi:hypothetical protein